MTKATDIRIRSTNCTFESVTFRTPIKFGGRVQSKSFLINVDVEVESRDGKRHAAGFGSMPVGNIWAWPSDTVDKTSNATAANRRIMSPFMVILVLLKDFS